MIRMPRLAKQVSSCFGYFPGYHLVFTVIATHWVRHGVDIDTVSTCTSRSFVEREGSALYIAFMKILAMRVLA